MATHRVLVRTQTPDMQWWEAGQLVDYDGPGNWKFEPIEPKAREAWLADVAQPDRVDETHRVAGLTGCFDQGDEPFPPGGAPAALPGVWGKVYHAERPPVSGWQG